MAENVLNNKRLPFALILAGILVMGTFGMTTAGGGEAQTPFQYGTVSCTIVSGADSCAQFATITFNPPFPAGQFINEICSLDGAASTNLRVETFEAQYNYFLSVSTPQTWVGGMPIALTELFANTNNRLFLDTGFIVQVELGVLVVNPSTSGNAVLDLQYSTSQAGPWISVGLNVPVNTAGLQWNGIAPPPVGIVNLIQYYRIVGQNGNGVADVPSFTKIYVGFSYTPGRALINLVRGDNTFFQCSFTMFTADVDATVVFDWSANVCNNGATSC